MDLKGTGREGVDWMHLGENRDHRRDLLNHSSELSSCIKGGKVKVKLSLCFFN
jgi:hypothetical protein